MDGKPCAGRVGSPKKCFPCMTMLYVISGEGFSLIANLFGFHSTSKLLFRLFVDLDRFGAVVG